MLSCDYVISMNLTCPAPVSLICLYMQLLHACNNSLVTPDSNIVLESFCSFCYDVCRPSTSSTEVK